MKNLLFALLCLSCSLTGMRAATKPIASTDENTVWYIIQFLNGENALTAQGDGEKVKTGVPTGKASQLWKLEGTDATGYKLTSKTGLVLYTENAQLNGMFYASSTPNTYTKFKLQTTTNTTYSDGWVISPRNNNGLFMNQWAGAGTGKELGLWNDRSDGNQPLVFIEESEFLTDASPLPLIPYPNSVTRGEGNLSIKDFVSVTYTDDAAKPIAEQLAEQLAQVSGKTFATEPATEAKKGAISFVKDETLADEEYKLEVNADGIVITASAYGGYFYGMQTLRQLMPVAIYKDETDSDWENWNVPFVTIEDKPILEWRGFHFDVSRHFFTMDEVKKLLDAAATFKLNRFHWHLTDDQGWRIEIPEYPKLTTIGAERKGSFTLEGGGSNGYDRFFDDTPYGKGCFFTLEQLKEMVAYAKKLNIEIIPEIDLPGHMQAVLAAYPEFSCYPDRKYEVRLLGGINPDVLNVGDDKVVDFLKCVLGHVAETFPYNYIHLGGDECPTTRWQELYNAAGDNTIKKRMADNGLTNVGQLQPWLVQELGSWLKETYNKDVTVWDELLHFWDNEKFTFKPLIMAWNSETLAYKAWNEYGLESITVPYQKLYLDFPQVYPNQELIDEPYVGGWGVNTLDEIYNWNPLAQMLNGTESHMHGVQGNLWTETTSSLKEAEYQYYPRIFALSEIAWLQNDKKNWISFYQRMQQVVKILDAKNIIYAKHFIEGPEYTPLEALQVEADKLLADTRAGQVGYPSQEACDALKTARENLTDKDQLAEAIAAFKAAPLTMPEAGKYYKINSASTATRYRYDGSSMYVSDNTLKVHYTPQTENEELFRFTPTEDGKGFILTHATSNKALVIGKINENVSMNATDGTPVSITRPAANRQYDYIPGVIVLTATADAELKTNARHLFNDYSGILSANRNDTLCYGATWRITEVENYVDFLQSVLTKCEEIVATARPGEEGEPTQEAIDLLTNDFITPAREAVKGTVTQERYAELAAVYDQYLAIPHVPVHNDVIGTIDSKYYYKIQNAWNTDRYAGDNGRGIILPGNGAGDRYLWEIRKNADNTVTFVNKATGNYPCASATNGIELKSGTEPTSWWLATTTVNDGREVTATSIMEPTKQYSWYSHGPSTVIMRPYDYAAGVWNLIKQKVEVPVGINDVIAAPHDSKGHALYDLSGRRVRETAHGIYITGQGKKVMK